MIDKIKLGGHIIKVEYVSTKEIDNGGTYNNYHNIIRIEKEDDTPEDNVMEILLHEIIEAIKLKNNLTLDHTVLTVISESLFQVLTDNNIQWSSK